MNIIFDKPVPASSRKVSFGRIPYQADSRKVCFRYIIGTLKHYEQSASIGYIDDITIGTLDPRALQWFSNAITS